MLKYKQIEIETYKEDKNIYRFKNPYQSLDGKLSTYRQVIFEPRSDISHKTSMINISHPLFVKMKNELYGDNSLGSASVFKVYVDKFQGVKGLWFVFKLFVTNNVNKNKADMISVFMEDDGFFNGRISRFLKNSNIDKFEFMHNVAVDDYFDDIYENAKKKAEEEALDIFESIKLEWTDEINKYEHKLKDYFQFKQNSILKIPIENIRDAQLKSLKKDYEAQIAFCRKQKNVVPKMDLYQFAYLEFA